MQRTLIALLALSLLTMAPAATATHDTFEEDGEILVGQPTTFVIGGVSELAAPCDTGSDLNGVDGQWHDIAGFGDHTFELTMEDTLDADVWFYDADCGFLDNGGDGSENLFGATEDGTVPSNAAFAVVDGKVGTGAYTLSIS